MCGDNEGITISEGKGVGTPPRVWGQHWMERFKLLRNRNTPTCVGTTYFIETLKAVETEHPHVCGDN